MTHLATKPDNAETANALMRNNDRREVSAATPMEMIDRALANNATPEMLDKLLSLQERWEANEGKKAFDRAIAAAKAAFPPIIKNREVDFTSQKGRTHYRHEDLDEIRRAVDPALAEHGLSYRWRTAQDGNTLTVTCILSHRDGYREETQLSGPVDTSGNKNALQAIGSAGTYLFRYTLKAALGLSIANDDDGRAAGEPETITAEQLSNLLKEIKSAGADEEAFCKWLGVETLADLPASRFWDAVKGLQVKKARAAETVTQTETTKGGDE